MDQCEGPDCRFEHNRTREHLTYHVMHNISTIIPCADIDLLPSRNNFVDRQLSAAFKNQIKTKMPLLFMPTSVTERNDYQNRVSKYTPYIFGVLPCGTKTCVILTNVKVYFDVLVPDHDKPAEFAGLIKSMMFDKKLQFLNITHIEQFKLHGFQTDKSKYVRICFNNLQDRKKGLDFIRSLSDHMVEMKKPPLETAADDEGEGAYFQKIAREFRFATADWNRIEEYTLTPMPGSNCAYVFSVDVTKYIKLKKSKRSEIINKGTRISRTIDRDPTLVGSWDIETYSTNPSGAVPKATDTDYTIFMICSAYFWHHSDEPIIEVCVVDQACNARSGIKVIVECGTEHNVVSAHMDVLGKMAPDILTAFNGACFDWPLYREKATRYGLLVKLKSNLSSIPCRDNETEEAVTRWHFKPKDIKIDAETKQHLMCVAWFPGMLDTDAYPTFMQMYPKAEVGRGASLNFFLAKNNLESKEDMPYKRMFRIYERAVKMANIKNCHCGSAQSLCGTCCEHVKEIDYKKCEDTENASEYTSELHDTLLRSEAGCFVEKCCFCGKKPKNLADMTEVGYYCVVDCIRPQQLFVKRTIIPDKRELSTMSYVPLFDSFYHANGMKVCNLIGAYCNKWDIAFSNARSRKSDSEKDHYPGAWVFPPNTGLHSDGEKNVEVTLPDGTKKNVSVRERPITGLDFASLYPSLMMTYNFSPDTVVKLKEEADRLIALGYTLREIKPFSYEKGAKKGEAQNKQMTGHGWTVRHNGIYNPKKDGQTISGYVKVIVHSNADSKIKYRADVGPSARDIEFIAKNKTRRSVAYEPIYGRAPLPGERIGIFAYIVKKLFDKRVPIKREFVRLAELKEKMELAKMGEVVENGVTYTIEEVEFNINKVESKQKALKLLANTFYGKSGDFRAFIYELLVAAGITCAGQENIKKVERFVASKGFITHYGDTDSLYLSAPDSYYAECDAVYYAAMEALAVEFAGVPCEPMPTEPGPIEYKRRRIELRLAWWHAQVEITMRCMDTLKEEVSDYLLHDNGTTRLNMAYEEVGFPSILCGKKKYAMVAHLKDINFYPKDYFIRGIEFIKQGQAKIAKELGLEFLKEALSPENERQLIDIANDKVRKFYTVMTDPALFMQSGRYKPDKKNVPVQTFTRRMCEIVQRQTDPHLKTLYEPPEAGDKFDYVIVKKEQRYTICGKKIEIKKGDQMEFVRVYKASLKSPNPMELDLDYYIKKSILGTFARFIAYHDDFQPPAGTYDVSDKAQYREKDIYCTNKATTYLENLCDSITGFDKTVLARQGRDYRAIYHRANKYARFDLARRYGSMGFMLHGLSIHDGNVCRSTMMLRQIIEMADDGSEFATQYVKGLLSKFSVFDIKKIYNGAQGGISRARVGYCNKREKELTAALYEVLPNVAKITDAYEKKFVSVVEDIRTVKYDGDVVIGDEEMDYLNLLCADDFATVSAAHTLMIELIAVISLRARTLSICNRIEMIKSQVIDAEH